jgi:anti-anti-sigma factor
MVVVTLPAEIDLTNHGLVQASIANALATKPNVVVADGTGTGFCDCSAIAALIAAHHQASAAGAQLRVVVNSAAVRRVLELLNADQILLLYPSLGHAEANGSQSPAPHQAG